MDKEALRELQGELDEYLSEFSSCFRSRPSREHMATYVRGQIGPLQRKSIEPIALAAGTPPRTLQQFVGAHRWDEGAMRAKVRRILARDHADPDAIGVIDETSFDKKGSKTIGIKRQWCGHTGKIDNCVQTVHLTYVAPDFATIADSDIFLPEDWANDRERRVEAGVPEEIEFKKKWEIALALTRRTLAEGVALKWITADEFYGRVSAFHDAIAAMGLTYVVEIPVSLCGWTPRRFARGKEHRRVDQLFKRGGPSWQTYHVKDSTKGPIVWRARASRFIRHAGEDRTEQTLLIAENVLTGETKYFLSNASADVSTETLLTVAFTRWRVEHNFEESKQEVGLDHFEVRTYRAVQRHLALSMVSLLFLVKASHRLRGRTTARWTVPQTRLLVDTLVDQELSTEGRAKRVDIVLRKVAYWQRRNKAAEVSHKKTRIARLLENGIDVHSLRRCPSWPSGAHQKVAL